MINPQRGEVWNVSFFPQQDPEISKTRPAVVINEDSIGRLPLKIVVPITGWNTKHDQHPWLVKLRPTDLNGLFKISTGDCFQVKSKSIDCFKKHLGSLTPDELTEIVSGVALCIGYSLA